MACIYAHIAQKYSWEIWKGDRMMDNPHGRREELENKAYETFVCPNLSLIDIRGRELKLNDATIERAKDLAIEYFKRTRRDHHYSSVKYLLPAFTYIATIIEDERRTQLDIGNVYGVTRVTIRKWYLDIMSVLDINIVNNKGSAPLYFPSV